MRNSGNHSNNVSGVKGVVWHKKGKKWAAEISVSYTKFYLGLFLDFDEAVCTRLAAEQHFDWGIATTTVLHTNMLKTIYRG